MPTATYAVKVDWDGSGTYADNDAIARGLSETAVESSETMTSRVKTAERLRISRGRDQLRALSPAAAGKARLVFKNTDKVLSPGNTGSALYNRVLPGKLVRVQAVYSGVTYNLFTGRLESIEYRPEVVNRDVALTALGTLARLSGLGASSEGFSTALYQNIRTDQAIGRILDAVGWSDVSDRVFDTGQTTLAWWWLAESENPFDALQALIWSEGPGAALFEDGRGRVVFHNRHRRTLNAASNVSQATFRDSGVEPRLIGQFRYDPRLSDVVNVCKATYKRRTAKPLSVIWELGESVTLQPGQSRVFDVRSRDGEPFTGLVVQPGLDYSTGYDFYASFNGPDSSAGLGNDGTADTGQSWTILGGFAAFGVSDNRAYPLGDSQSHFTPSFPDGCIGVTLATVPQLLGLVFRWGSAAFYTHLSVYAGSQYNLDEFGTPGSGYFFGPAANGDRLLIRYTGANVIVDLNGVQVLSVAATQGLTWSPVGIRGHSAFIGYLDDFFYSPVAAVLDRTSGASAKLTLTNHTTIPQTVASLRARAQLVTVDDTIPVINAANAASSIGIYGRRAFDLPLRGEFDSINTVQALCDAVVSLYKDPRPQVQMVVDNSVAARLTQLLTREVADRVTIVSAHLDVNDDYWIEQISHEISEGGLEHRTMFGCEKAWGDNYGVWDGAASKWDEAVWGF